MPRTEWTTSRALAFVKKHGAVLASARGPLPSLAEAIVGETIKGSWWAHPQGQLLFRLGTAVAESREVLVCKLVGGKLTYVHRRLWPALLAVQPRRKGQGLDRVVHEHTPSGAHKASAIPYPKWLPPEVLEEAAKLDEATARAQLTACGIEI